MLLAGTSGLLLILCFPSVSAGALAWVSLVPLLAAVRGRTGMQGFILGCLAGTVFHCGLVYWVVVSMTRYGGVPLVVSIAALLALSVFLSLFIAVPVGFCCFLARSARIGFSLSLPVCWVAAEHAKSWFLTGFPWQNLGYSQYRYLHFVQIADITGIYGVSFVLVLCNCAAAALLHSLCRGGRICRREPAAAAALIAVVLLYGHERLSVFKAYGHRSSSPVRLTIVQPNIAQHMKWDPAYLAPTLEIFNNLTLQAARANPRLIVWPESATPFYFESEPVFRDTVAGLVRSSGSHLLVGSPAHIEENGKSRYFNSAYLVSPENEIMSRYDKLHLVPYGEYVPLSRLFPFIEKLVAGVGDFSPGRAVTLQHLPSCTFGTVICYEVIFPDLVRKFVARGADFLVNITNDAWFGTTSAPEQHLSMAALRAVENRRYLARAANTGISAVIGPDGGIRQRTKLFTQTILPAKIYCCDSITVYTRFGDMFACACWAAVLVLFAGMRRRRAGPGGSERFPTSHIPRETRD